MKKLMIKTPGKLMIAGEYAVLEPYQPLIVTAVDRFIYTTISDAEQNSLYLHGFKVGNLKWEYVDDDIVLERKEKRFNFVKTAMKITLNYLSELHYEIPPMHIGVKSELRDKSGVKYGLGSSAAVVTSVVRAILTFVLAEKPTDKIVFKLAAIAHVKVQGSGSGADIAASAYTGILCYTSFQSEWLLRQMKRINEMTRLVSMDWRFLSIKRCNLPNNLTMLVAWTGKAASTKQLVAKIKRQKNKKSSTYKQFLKTSNTAVENILHGMEQNNMEMFFEGIERNQLALGHLGRSFHVPIVTTKLRKMSQLAKSFHGRGKLSGAGGGDCGIAFFPDGTDTGKLKSNWEKHGITLLDLQIYNKVDNE